MKIFGYVYLLRSESTGWCKIGYSKDPVRRLAQLHSEHPELEWNFVTSIRTDDCRRLERAFHRVFAEGRVVREREWFKLEDHELEFFEALASALRVSYADFPALGSISDDLWGQVVKELERVRPHIAAVCSEAKCRRFTEDELVLEFPKSLAFYPKVIEVDPRGKTTLLPTIERLHGIRPHLRLEVGDDGA